MNDNDNKSEAEKLRQKAEELLKTATPPVSITTLSLSETDPAKLIHELQVHQVELEMQNEELRNAWTSGQIVINKYTELYEFAPTGYLSLSKEGRIVESNFSASQMLGKDRQRLIHSSFAFFVSKDTKPVFDLFFKNIFTNEIKETCELTLIKNDCSPVYVQLTGLLNENGNQCLISIVDITTHRQMENELKLSESKFRTLFESANDAIFMMDEKVFLDCNTKTEILFGCGKEDIIGHTPAQFSPRLQPDGRLSSEKSAEKIHAALAGNPQIFYWKHQNYDGTPFDAEVSLNKIEIGGESCLQAIVRDISDRIQTSKALRESEEKYSLLAEHITDIVWLMDMDFKVTYQSPSSEKLRGFTSQEIKDLPMEKNLTPASLKLALESFSREMQKTETNKDYLPLIKMELEYYCKDGTTIWLENKFSLIRDDNGNPISILGEGRDIADRKQAEEALIRSLSLLEATLESIHNGILVISSQGAVVKTNAKFAEMWQIPEHVLASGDDSTLLNYVMTQLSDPEEFIAKVKELYEKPKSESFDLMNFKDGRIFERISKPMMLDGKPKGRVWSFLDVTMRSRTNEALQEERWRLANIVEATRAGTWEWNIPTGETVYNEQYAQMVGYTLGELSPTSIKTWETMTHPNDLMHSYKLLEQYFAGELSYYNCEYRMKHKDGHWVWIHDRGQVVTHSDDGKPVMMFGTHTDISDRKQAEKELKDSESHAHALIDAIPDLMFRLSSRGVFLDYKAAKEDLAYQTQSIIGKNIREIFSPAFADMGDEKLEQTLLTGKMQIFEYQLSFPSGRIRDFEARMVPSGPDEVTTIVRDVTERKKTEAEIILKNEQLLQSNIEKDKFFSIVAHDLRGPFNAFLGFTQMFVEELDTFTLKDLQRIALSMQNSATNLFGLLENLLEWSRLRRGVTDFKPATFLLKDFGEESLISVMEPANKKGIEIRIEIPENIAVYADRYMLASILRNLVSNATKFTCKGGIIRLTAKSDSDHSAEIAISDTGIGMNENMIENLFRLDEQTNRKGTEGEPSTGL
ncbi:MAG: PAS domain S-box protein, partial [Bacteroidota bacterium]